jgi:hypothetical protein
MREELKRASEIIDTDIGKLIARLERECPSLDLALIGHLAIRSIQRRAGDEDQPLGNDWVSAYLAEKLLEDLDINARRHVLTEACTRLLLIEAAIWVGPGEDEEGATMELLDDMLGKLRQHKASIRASRARSPFSIRATPRRSRSSTCRFFS